jgi:integrase
MARRATDPIPVSIRESFFACMWSVAADGKYVGDRFSIGDGLSGHRVWMLRRHAIVCLWLTALAARFSELRRLLMQDVSIGAGSAFVTRSKRGKHASVRVSPELIDVTLNWRAQNAKSKLGESKMAGRKLPYLRARGK